jgi:hypothetical protein
LIESVDDAKCCVFKDATQLFTTERSCVRHKKSCVHQNMIHYIILDFEYSNLTWTWFWVIYDW